jgi:four helix bundle protein
MLKNYKELKVWQKSYELCLKIYRMTTKFPKEEKYGLTAQIRRSAVSIPSNIAEGYGRKTTLDYVRMLYISYGSVCELETQILLAGDLDLLEKGELSKLKKDITEIERMLKALIKSLEKKPLNPWTLKDILKCPLNMLIFRICPRSCSAVWEGF